MTGKNRKMWEKALTLNTRYSIMFAVFQIRSGKVMQVVKRDGKFAEYDRTKIAVAIGKANAEVEEGERASEKEIKQILDFIEHKGRKRMLVEDIQDIIEERLMA